MPTLRDALEAIERLYKANAEQDEAEQKLAAIIDALPELMQGIAYGKRVVAADRTVWQIKRDVHTRHAARLIEVWPDDALDVLRDGKLGAAGVPGLPANEERCRLPHEHTTTACMLIKGHAGPCAAW